MLTAEILSRRSINNKRMHFLCPFSCCQCSVSLTARHLQDRIKLLHNASLLFCLFLLFLFFLFQTKERSPQGWSQTPWSSSSKEERKYRDSRGKSRSRTFWPLPVCVFFCIGFVLENTSYRKDEEERASSCYCWWWGEWWERRSQRETTDEAREIPSATLFSTDAQLDPRHQFDHQIKSKTPNHFCKPPNCVINTVLPLQPITAFNVF